MTDVFTQVLNARRGSERKAWKRRVPTLTEAFPGGVEDILNNVMRAMRVAQYGSGWNKESKPAPQSTQQQLAEMMLEVLRRDATVPGEDLRKSTLITALARYKPSGGSRLVPYEAGQRLPADAMVRLSLGDEGAAAADAGAEDAVPATPGVGDFSAWGVAEAEPIVAVVPTVEVGEESRAEGIETAEVEAPAEGAAAAAAAFQPPGMADFEPVLSNVSDTSRRQYLGRINIILQAFPNGIQGMLTNQDRVATLIAYGSAWETRRKQMANSSQRQYTAILLKAATAFDGEGEEYDSLLTYLRNIRDRLKAEATAARRGRTGVRAGDITLERVEAKIAELGEVFARPDVPATVSHVGRDLAEAIYIFLLMSRYGHPVGHDDIGYGFRRGDLGGAMVVSDFNPETTLNQIEVNDEDVVVHIVKFKTSQRYNKLTVLVAHPYVVSYFKRLLAAGQDRFAGYSQLGYALGRVFDDSDVTFNKIRAVFVRFHLEPDFAAKFREVRDALEGTPLTLETIAPVVDSFLAAGKWSEDDAEQFMGEFEEQADIAAQRGHSLTVAVNEYSRGLDA